MCSSCLTVLTLFADIRTRYTNLKRYLENAVEVLQEAQIRHRQLDSDIVKIDLWLKEAENLLAKPLQLNSATEIIREQVKKYQVSLKIMSLLIVLSESITGSFIGAL